MTDFLPFNATTHPIIRVVDDWNNQLDHGLERTATYVIRQNGIYTEAIKGGTSSGAGTIAYGGPGNIGAASGTDPSAVWQATLAAMTGGGRLYVKAGLYQMTTSIPIAASTSDLAIVAEPGAILKYPAATAECHALFTSDAVGTVQNRVLIDGLTVDGNKANVTQPTNNAECVLLTPFFLNNFNYITIRNCYLHDFYGFGIVIHFAITQDYTGAYVHHNRFYNAGDSTMAYHSGGGIYSSNNDTWIADNHLLTFSGTGLNIDHSNGWIINNTIRDQTGGHASTDFAICTGYGASDVWIQGNHISTLTRRCIGNHIGDVAGETCDHHVITHNYIDAEDGITAAIWLLDDRHIVKDNVIFLYGTNTAVSAQGIVIDTGASADVTGNYMYQVRSNAITVLGSAKVQNNDVLGGEGDATGSGIVFSGNPAVAVGPISGNMVRDGTDTLYSIYFFNTLNDMYVTDNQFDLAPATPPATAFFYRNIGYVTENSGTGSIASGTTADIITHGCDYTPAAADITITLTENPTNTPGAIWVDTIGAATFTVNCENDPGASNLDFSWAVRKR